MHTEKPNKPNNGAGSIHSSESAEAIVTLYWSSPENHNHTTIAHYKLTLIGTHSNTTTTVHVGAEPQQSFSHLLMVSERNYSSASIIAVDACGQESEPSHFELTEIVTETQTFLTPANCTILASILGGIALALLIILVLIIICFVVIKQCHK